MEFRHEPVLLDEVLQWMNVKADGVYCDGTLGGGGHSEALLRASGGTARLFGIDRDETAIRAASERLAAFPRPAPHIIPQIPAGGRGFERQVQALVSSTAR